MTFSGVADTHVVLWYLFADPRLSLGAKAFIDQAAASRQKIAVSSITLIETVYLVEKQRVRASAFDDVMAALADTTHVFEVRAVTPKVALVMRSIPRDQVPTCPIESSPQLLCTWAFP